jgi:hypothetical protein
MHVSLHAKDASPPLPIVYDSSFRFQNRSLDTPPEDDRSMTATVSAVVETWTHAVLPFILISQRCRACTRTQIILCSYCTVHKILYDTVVYLLCTFVLSKYFRTFVRKYEGTYCRRVIYLRVCFRTRVRVRTMVYIQYSYSFIDRWLGLALQYSEMYFRTYLRR